MLTYLLVAGDGGGALPAAAVAELERLPWADLAHEPETVVRWLAKGDRVGVAAWQTRPGVHGGAHWHVGDHGLTLFAGTPWPAPRSWRSPTGWAFELTDRLEHDVVGTLVSLGGAWSVVRVGPDGDGLVTAGPVGGGPVWVGTRDGVTAVSNRAAVVAGVLGARPRRGDDRASARLVARGTIGGGAPYAGLRRLAPGEVLRLDVGHGAHTDDEGTAWGRPADLDRATAAVRAAVAGAAATASPARFVDLSGAPGACAIVAAIAATATADAFRYRVAGDDHDAACARVLADHLGVHLETDHEEHLPDDIDPLAEWLRQRISRTEGTVAADVLTGVRASDGAVVLRPTYGAAFTGLERPADGLLLDGARHLTEEEDRRVDEAERRAGATDATLPGRRALHLDLPTIAGAEDALLGPALRIDPLQHPAVVAFAARQGPAGLDELVRALDPPTAGVVLPVRESGPTGAPWRTLAPLVEAYASGHAAAQLEHLVDATAVRTVVRTPEPPPGVAPSLWGLLTAAVWTAERELPWRVTRRAPRVSTPLEERGPTTTLVTGITSRSLIELSGLRLGLDELGHDPLLGIRVDERLAELCDRVLLAVDATPGALPRDLPARLASGATAPFAEVARALAAQRGGVLADPRLGLLVPFWRTQVSDVRVVLVTERPSELLARTPSPLPGGHLLARWLDLVATTLSDREEVRVLDPRDIADIDAPEGVAPPADGSAGHLLQLTTVVDSLIRELDGESVRPILQQLLAARTAPDVEVRERTTGGAPLRVVDDLWRDVVAVDGLRARADEEASSTAAELAAARADLEALRGLRSVRLAERLFRRESGTP